jgi:hypothetical protein
MLALFTLSREGSLEGIRSRTNPSAFPSPAPFPSSVPFPPASVNSVLGVYPDLVGALKSTFGPSTISADDSSSIPSSQRLPGFSTPQPMRAHSNVSNPISFMRLLHDSLDTRGWGPHLVTHHSFTPSAQGPLTTIPFRITFFAHPHPLTPIESHSCKKQGVGVSRGSLDPLRKNCWIGGLL